MSFLLGSAANPGKSDREGELPLHLAVASGCTSAVQALLHAMTSPAAINITNRGGLSPLDVCHRLRPQQD